MACLSINYKKPLASDNVHPVSTSSSASPPQYYQTRKDYFDGPEKTLHIPKDKAVLAAGYTPSLRSQENCMIFSTIMTKLDSKIDIVVVPGGNAREKENGHSETATLNLYKESGYKESNLSTKDVLIFGKITV